MMNNLRRDEVWAARLELRTREGTEEYRKGLHGGFVTVLVRCASKAEFLQAAAEHVGEEGFDILAVDDLAPLSDDRFEMNDLINELFHRTAEYPVQWSSFNLYPAD